MLRLGFPDSSRASECRCQSPAAARYADGDFFMSAVPLPSTLGLQPSFGFGDRTGFATPGHVAAMKRSGRFIKPIFAQQSIREMTRTQRTPEMVMKDAIRGME